MGSWCLAWTLDGVSVGSRKLWWVVEDLGGMEYLSKLVFEMALGKLG